MKILLFGKNGQVGWELQRTLGPLGQIEAIDQPDLNLVDAIALERKILDFRPTVIVNAAAYTAVDKAEQETQMAFAVNAAAPEIMAKAAQRTGSVMIHFSTDFVFDGNKGQPYKEDDLPHPLNQYGHSKLEGEERIRQVGGVYLILRTSWVYSLRGDNFVTKILTWSRKNPNLQIVTDQVGSPTWARMLAETIAILLGRSGGDTFEYFKKVCGLYHLAGSGQTSRFEWGQAILKNDPGSKNQVTKNIQPALSHSFPTPALRPAFSALDCSRFTRTFDLQLPPWEKTLALALSTG